MQLFFSLHKTVQCVVGSLTEEGRSGPGEGESVFTKISELLALHEKNTNPTFIAVLLCHVKNNIAVAFDKQS